MLLGLLKFSCTPTILNSSPNCLIASPCAAQIGLRHRFCPIGFDQLPANDTHPRSLSHRQAPFDSRVKKDSRGAVLKMAVEPAFYLYDEDYPGLVFVAMADGGAEEDCKFRLGRG